jgi:hypothetical protein
MTFPVPLPADVQPNPPVGGIAVYYVAACTFCSSTQGTIHYDFWTETESEAQAFALQHVQENPAHHVPITQRAIDYAQVIQPVRARKTSPDGPRIPQESVSVEDPEEGEDL